jgi:hypothetical protein
MGQMYESKIFTELMVLMAELLRQLSFLFFAAVLSDLHLAGF